MDHEKTLKGMSIFSIVLGAFCTLITFVLAFYGWFVVKMSDNKDFVEGLTSNARMQSYFGMRGTYDSPEETVKMIGMVIIVIAVYACLVGIFNIARGIVGLKAVNGNCLTAAMVLGILALIGDAISFILGIINTNGFAIRTVYLAVSILYVYCVKQIKDFEDNRAVPTGTTTVIHRNTIEDEAEKFFR